jgi:hypothetical protein
MFLHDEATWQKFWADVGRETATEWTVEVEMRPVEYLLPLKRDTAWMDEDARGLLFEVRRVR